MYCLKNAKCSCGGKYILVTENGIVSHATCEKCFKIYILPQDNAKTFILENCEKYTRKNNILECSSQGDKRFSAFFAKVSVYGKIATIEQHYQSAKMFYENNQLVQYEDIKKCKGKKPIAFKIGDYILPLRFGSMFYNLLWYKYLTVNPKLQDTLEQYSDYKDNFKGSSYVCQADSIRMFMNDIHGEKLNKSQRGTRILSNCKPLLDCLNRKITVIVEEGDLFESYADILGHQVNCRSKMGSGIALTLKNAFPKAYNDYMSFSAKNKGDLLGKCQIVDCGHKYIANLFGQDNYGTNKNIVYTNYIALEKALQELKVFAKTNNKTVAIPYNIGCDRGNGDWQKVFNIIMKVFSDYYVILYKYNKK